jgi:hypothetical protein
MHVNIEYKNKEYTLGYDRKTARDLSEALSKVGDIDIYERAALTISFALIQKHPELSETRRMEIAEYVCEAYPVINLKEDIEDDDAADEEIAEEEPGLLSLLTEMINDTIPKGFIGRATKTFKVIR